jgi:hypothetical protein
MLHHLATHPDWLLIALFFALVIPITFKILVSGGAGKSGIPKPEAFSTDVSCMSDGTPDVMARDAPTRVEEDSAALPAQGSMPWWQVLAVPRTATRSEIEAAFRNLARERHPDRGGSEAMMSELNVARDQALKAAA